MAWSLVGISPVRKPARSTLNQSPSVLLSLSQETFALLCFSLFSRCLSSAAARPERKDASGRANWVIKVAPAAMAPASTCTEISATRLLSPPSASSSMLLTLLRKPNSPAR